MDHSAKNRPHLFRVPHFARGVPLPHGFSLVELLVVIAIIGVLISLLLPAVQAARESARRLQCVNNLKQIALATQNFESANKLLPPSGDVELLAKKYGIIDYESFQQTKGRQISWVVFLLPFMEQQQLHDQFEQDKTVFEQTDDPQATVVDQLLCPSDSARGRYFVDEAVSLGRRFAKGNYAAYCSPYHTDIQMVHPGAIIARGQSLEKVVDGLSNTVAFGEIRTRDHEQDERGAWALPWTAASLLAFDMHHEPNVPFDADFVAEVRTANQTQLPNTLGPNFETLQICPDLVGAQLEGMPCLNANTYRYLSAPSRSHHPGGVNAAYLDGRVNFLLDDIDTFVMAYLISVHDGQLSDNQKN